MSEQSQWIQELHEKEARDAFVSSQMSIPMAFQILALREQRGWTQKELAEKAGMLQPRIAAMEHPSGSEPNLRTLKRLASAFDVALIVRFAPFSELVEWAERFSPDTFVVPSFEDDPGFHRNIAAADMLRLALSHRAEGTKVQHTMGLARSPFSRVTRQKSAHFQGENLDLDFGPAMPSRQDVPAQPKITDTTRQGAIKYEGSVGSTQRPAA